MIVTRFPPSPTGHLHIWSVRTALYNWLLARQQGGKFIFRIEDTDTARSTRVYEQDFIEGFERLGLDRDAGITKETQDGVAYRQMERLDIYKERVQRLLDQWAAYYARETTEELDAMRAAAEAARKPFVYRKPDYTDAALALFNDEGRIPVIRLAVDPACTIPFFDAVKGETSFEGKDIGDFVIVKGDGVPTYHLAVVVDDITMNVTHVIRGEDHFSNTPKHILLYQAFGETIPQYAHLPLIMNKNGKKMSKRDEGIGLTLIHQFRDAGFMPEAVLNFIALVGRNPWTEQEIFTLDELTQIFSLERVIKSNAVYDFDRALWYNSERTKRLSDKEFVEKVKNYLYLYGGEERKMIVESMDEAYRLKFAPYIKVRLQTFWQFRMYGKYLFERVATPAELVYREKMGVTPELLQEALPEVIAVLERISVEQRNEETIKNDLITYIAAKGYKNGQVLRPLRAIITGVEASPGAFEMLYVLGKEESLVRLREFTTMSN